MRRVGERSGWRRLCRSLRRHRVEVTRCGCVANLYCLHVERSENYEFPLESMVPKMICMYVCLHVCTIMPMLSQSMLIVTSIRYAHSMTTHLRCSYQQFGLYLYIHRNINIYTYHRFYSRYFMWESPFQYLHAGLVCGKWFVMLEVSWIEFGSIKKKIIYKNKIKILYEMQLELNVL